MKKINLLLVLIMPLVLLLGCETPGDAAKGSDGKGGADVEDRSASASGAKGGAAFSGHPLDNPDSPLANRVIYFDFDSSTIPEAARETIAAHAAYLSKNPGATVVLEGHCDERGTREYNIALGERRSKAVAQLMSLQGAGNGQMNSISYGEERPAASGHDESAWALNRRVEVIYKSR